MKKDVRALSQVELKARLHYSPDAGLFTWIASPRSDLIGKTAGAKRISKGKPYTVIEIGGVPFSAHRLAWLYMTGAFPPDEIDHIDGDGRNNRFSNLRLSNRRLNMQNRRAPGSSNTSGYLGVSYYKKNQKWGALIVVSEKKRFLGLFENPEFAYGAYLAAKRRHHEGCTI